MMKQKRISVLTLQETHLSEDYANTIRSLYGKRLSIHFSVSEENTTGKAGVAIVLNKDLVWTDKVSTTELIPGHALLLQAPWHAGSTFCWLAVYAPNNEKESKEMWETLTQMWIDLHLPNPDGMSGDFNLVEDAVNRLPVHEDNKSMGDAFRNFCMKLMLCDGWREVNEDAWDFSFMQMSGKFSQSHINCIYVSKKLLKNCDEWDIHNPPIGTDHRVVSGCWTMPLHLLRNEKALKEADDIVKRMASELKDIASMRSDENNPQLVYARAPWWKTIDSLQRHYSNKKSSEYNKKSTKIGKHQT
ncbi:hypothetical protein IW261DRAFT_1554261 [Armillaria novae-zelandiae]|uniref:Endonuclease/exonuclease/phosphatase domain-containing protein n=1 Tax=Armillaria novae-zelandiae TaxID=153914 RepID=A0AA39NBS5_9AGAR|nr:hypothetical protein IW261DRAFT_1554261 [Armillaria novae-zelandiae]